MRQGDYTEPNFSANSRQPSVYSPCGLADHIPEVIAENGRGGIRAPIFEAAPKPTQEDIEWVVQQAKKRILRYLGKRGVSRWGAAGGTVANAFTTWRTEW